jgi:hypothetical protein
MTHDPEGLLPCAILLRLLQKQGPVESLLDWSLPTLDGLLYFSFAIRAMAAAGALGLKPLIM